MPFLAVRRCVRGPALADGTFRSITVTGPQTPRAEARLFAPSAMGSAPSCPGVHLSHGHRWSPARGRLRLLHRDDPQPDGDAPEAERTRRPHSRPRRLAADGARRCRPLRRHRDAAAAPHPCRARHRRPALLFAPGHRPVRPRPCDSHQPESRPLRAGRLDHHAAARQEHLPHLRAHLDAQVRGTGAGPLAGAAPRQAGHSRALPQSGVLRRRRLRRGIGRPTLLQQERDRSDHGRGRRAGGPAQGAVQIFAGLEPRPCPRARRRRAGQDGGSRLRLPYRWRAQFSSRRAVCRTAGNAWRDRRGIRRRRRARPAAEPDRRQRP